MVADGRYDGIVDRIVDGETAVVLLEADGTVESQIEIPKRGLPRGAREDGAVLEVVISEGRLERLAYDPEATERRREDSQSRFDRLAERMDDG